MEDASSSHHASSSRSSSTFPPDSPSASTFLRTAETLEGLAQQLGHIKDESEVYGEARCCCGALLGAGGTAQCRMARRVEGMEDKLKLSGEIGNALLNRSEVLERKYQKEVERYEKQLDVKRTALADSVKRVHNLEKANHTHLQKYAELSRKMETVEKRYTQATHTQTLTQQSLTHVRAELTTLRDTAARQTIALASRGGVEESLVEAEKRYEDARDLAEEESRKCRDERRKRQRAELRIAELEEQVKVASKDADAIREARAQDAQELLANAKERLESLHADLSATFSADSPSEMPEYQRTLENLVANNTLLKHDAAELSHSLVESREEVRALRDEVEALRSSIGASSRAVSPLEHPRLAHELSPRYSHSRTESTPITGWNQPRMSTWGHHRKSSMAGSGLGMGPIGEMTASVEWDEQGRGPVSPVVESPKQHFRASPGTGIGYVLNGVPKTRTGSATSAASKRMSADSRIMRFSSRTIGSIDETTSASEDPPLSPGSDYFHAAEINRKRRSLLLSRRATMSPNEFSDYSPNASNTLVDQSVSADFPSPMSESALPDKEAQGAESPKVANRRTLLLLTRSRGVQTDPVEIVAVPQQALQSEKAEQVDTASASDSKMSSRGTSPAPGSDAFPDGSSNPDDAPASGLLVLVEHMSRILSKLRSADVVTLNKRLKRQNLPGDVMHLSQTTLRTLQQEVGDLRHHFRGVQNLGIIDPRDFNLLLRLMKDVFNDLVELQAVVNDVTITPSVAKKLQRAAYKAEEDEAAKQAKQASGLGWIAAPITKFFVTPAESTAETSTSSLGTGAGLDRGKSLALPKRAAPKQQAMASATATHVSVEFGGAGMVRRVAPATTTASVAVSSGMEGDGMVSPVNSNGTGSGASTNEQRIVSGPAAVGRTEGGLVPPQTIRTLRTVKSRANRNELLGIFAGAPPRVTTPTDGSWTVVGGGESGGRSGARGINASRLGPDDRTVRGVPAERKRLSAAVDAVIDASAVDDEDEDVAVGGSYEPPLLERQLRPRGLSDSSIRSTTVSHARDLTNEAAMASVGTARAPAFGATPAGASVFQTLSRKFYSFRAPEETASIPDSSASTTIAADTTPKRTPSSTPKSKSSATSPVRPIPRSPSRHSSISTTASSTRDRASISHQSAASPVTASSSQTGFFGYINSLASGAVTEGMGAVSEREEGEPEDELVGATLRQGGMMGHARVNSGKSGWR
ncbi:hypothetical protein IAT38_000612 [Cryptococcus sp. DSM 104549]